MKSRFTVFAAVIIFALISQSVQAESLFYSHIATSKSWDTEICMINTSTESVTGDFNFFSKTGVLVTTNKLTLKPGARYEVTMKTDFKEASDIAYASFESESTSLSGYTRFFITGTYRAAVPAFFLEEIDEIYLPHIASSSKWWTGVAMVNTLAVAKQVIIIFNTGIQKTFTLEPGAHTAFSIKSLFDGELQPDIKSAYINNAQGLAGLELFGCDAEYQLSGMLLKGESNKELFFPHVAKKPWWTGIVVYNPSLDSSELTITTYNSTGEQLSTIEQTVKAREKYIGNAITLNFPAETAWFKVDSTIPVTGFELFGQTGQLGGYVAVNLCSKQGYFPKIDKTGWTGIAFVNVTEREAGIVLSAFDDEGNKITSKLFTMEPGSKIVKRAQDFFDADISRATYIRYVSDRDVAGFQLNGNDPDQMLDALPALPAQESDTLGVGRFYDAPVAGLDYEQGKEKGVTLDTGIFLFQENLPISFAIGDIVLGQGDAHGIMTPIDLVPDARDETDDTVTNIVRFLMTLDDDDDPENGILIPESIKTAANRLIDFDQTPEDFQEDKSVTDMVETLTTLTKAGVRTLVDTASARGHMKTTLLSLLAGTYSGTFTGDEVGEWAVVIDDQGEIEGAGIHTRTGDFGITGSSQSNGTMLVVSGSAAYTATYTGTITRQGVMAGNWWEIDGDIGTYTGNKEEELTDPYWSSAIGASWVFCGYRQITPSTTWEETGDVLGVSTAKGYPRLILKQYNYHNSGSYKTFIVDDPYDGKDHANLIGTTRYHVDSDEDLRKETFAFYETLTVPAGTFETMKVISQSTEYISGLAYEDHIFPANQTWTNWFALDFFAMIKEVDYWVDGPAPMISELVSY